ncbi:MAG: Flp family type IVb pilin [Vicinamibacterales bacterium]
MTHLLRRLATEESGQDIIEYALVAAGIAVLLIPTVPTLGNTLVTLYTAITTKVAGVTPP